MEEAVREALLSAGGVLAEALRAGLSAGGHDAALEVRVEAGRVSVVSTSRDVWDAEMGRADRPPRASVAGIAAAAASDAVRALHARLDESVR